MNRAMAQESANPGPPQSRSIAYSRTHTPRTKRELDKVFKLAALDLLGMGRFGF
jgi:hypothetical protein